MELPTMGATHVAPNPKSFRMLKPPTVQSALPASRR
jgi:hypothetical protein